MKIGLIREWKQPADKRVALTPELCLEFKKRHPKVELVVEKSPDRTYLESEYEKAGVLVVSDVTDCDVLIGIKEVPVDKLIPNKTYLFFSHTIKAQPYNRDLLQAILEKNISLIDYEPLTWKEGGRILGFGKWAGVVGAYNAFLTWGKKTGKFDLPPAYETNDYEKSMELLAQLDLGKTRVVYTGNGRVAQGIQEVLELMKIRETSPQEFISQPPRGAYFTQLTSWDLYHRKDGGDWDINHFYNNHKEYCCEFDNFLPYTDILINGFYWEDDLPALFSKKDTKSDNFNIQVIADITCDVEGSVPITMEATDIYNPTFGWSRKGQKQVEPYGENTIDVMAVTNLPTEMPKNASTEFGTFMLDHIIPLLINGDEDGILKRARLTENGKLTDEFSYLQDFVEGK
ncbi:NAD(P)-dependent oxidoreductase [Bacteroidia bacterium]|nr:NAD(P)-dependent oxidoreductase [Bacteroidia bacterium]MDB4107811.1 NAD(P)-dependent oxidoreductase [Bacteroidia bacterium]MDB9882389.1 NAD(P)-dependent oxidoreductase [Bacteroidia bacterium]